MKKLTTYITVFSLIVLFLPYIVVSAIKRGAEPDVSEYTDTAYFSDTDDNTEPEVETISHNVSSVPSSVSVYIKNEDKTVFIDTDEYIKGVVLAEMPSSFHSEALKAQAVAARSCLYYNAEYYKTHQIPPEHNGAVICTDYNHCSAWRDIAGAGDEEKGKISEAVDATKDIVMLYDGSPINAVFHSTSSGTTESAEDVWGKNIPYLQSVASMGDDLSPRYTSVYEADLQKFRESAEQNIKGVDWNNPLFSDIKRSSAGGIISIKIGGVEISGSEFRRIYSLLSTNADIKEEDGKITISVKGYGHGVGMSQYGANYLASEGNSFESILKSYYSGVSVEKI